MVANLNIRGCPGSACADRLPHGGGGSQDAGPGGEETVGKPTVSIEQVQDTATAVVQQAQTTNGRHAEPHVVRFWASAGWRCCATWPCWWGW